MENLKSRFNNLKYKHFKINFIDLDFEIKLLDENSSFPNSDIKDLCGEFKVIITHKDKTIIFKFYNSIMEREISKYLKLNLESYPIGVLNVRDFKNFMGHKMWGGYDKIKNLRELTEERIYFLLNSIINCIAMERTTETDSFKFFCDSFGYEEDSRKAYKIFNTVIEQKEKIQSLNLTEKQIKYLDEEANQETDKFNKDIRQAIKQAKEL